LDGEQSLNLSVLVPMGIHLGSGVNRKKAIFFDRPIVASHETLPGSLAEIVIGIATKFATGRLKN
jgi:hypothetical protein